MSPAAPVAGGSLTVNTEFTELLSRESNGCDLLRKSDPSPACGFFCAHLVDLPILPKVVSPRGAVFRTAIESNSGNATHFCGGRIAFAHARLLKRHFGQQQGINRSVVLSLPRQRRATITISQLRNDHADGWPGMLLEGGHQMNAG